MDSKTKQEKKEAKALDNAVSWLRIESEKLDDPRQISLALLALNSSGDPVYSNHIQRLSENLKAQQIIDKKSPYFGSWGGNLKDTANALLALKRCALDQRFILSMPFMENGLEFLKKNWDESLNNWDDDIVNTLFCCQIILESADLHKFTFVQKALKWITNLQNENGNVVGINYTSKTLATLLLYREYYDEFSQNENKCFNFLKKKSRTLWSDDFRIISDVISVLIQKSPKMRVNNKTIQNGIDFLLKKQNKNGSWNNDVYKTASCITAISKKLRTTIIQDRAITFWSSYEPRHAVFHLSSEEIVKNSEIRVVGDLTTPNEADIEKLGTYTTNQFYFKSEMDSINRILEETIAPRQVLSRTAGKITQNTRQLQGDILRNIIDIGNNLNIRLFSKSEKENNLSTKISKNQIDHITIELDKNSPLGSIPWELLFDQGHFFSLQYSIGRRISNKRIRNDSNEKLRALLVSDPTGTLNETEQEIDEIKKILSSFAEVDVFKIRNPEDPKSDFTVAIRDGNYDIIHFAGHATLENNKSYLLFPDNTKIGAEEIGRFISQCSIRPKIVFFNACSSAARKVNDDTKYRFDKDFSELAVNFVSTLTESQVPVFIGAIVPVHDDGAAHFAKIFYNYLSVGCTVGDAMRIARIKSYLRDPYGLTWASFVLYGEIYTKLPRLHYRGILTKRVNK